ncbi:MAG: cupin domain-containing protein [Lysobacter sp.]|nr:cupin domain-containing protein [Lysobacter sp.]
MPAQPRHARTGASATSATRLSANPRRATMAEPPRQRVAAVTPLPSQSVDAEALPPMLLGSGCVRRALPAPPGARAWLVDMAPGSEWPWIDRAETGEAYFVLQGEVIDDGMHHPAGTQVVISPGGRHRPRSETGARLVGFHLEPDAFLGAGGNPDVLIGRLHLQQG